MDWRRVNLCPTNPFGIYLRMRIGQRCCIDDTANRMSLCIDGFVAEERHTEIVPMALAVGLAYGKSAATDQ